VNEIKRPKEEIKTAYIRTIRKLNKKRAAKLTGLPEDKILLSAPELEHIFTCYEADL
jgi:hypothetical protein